MRAGAAFLAGLLLLALAAPAVAADEGNVQGKEITFKSGDEEIKGFLAVPEGKGPFPGIVVIQEWWGLTDWIKDNAKRLAGRGYVCLAPDLYRGKVGTDFATAGQLAKGLPRDRALRDLKAAIDTLAANEQVDKARIGSIGWCMGGGFSLALALNDPRVTACAICYGQPVTDPKMLEPLQATVLGIFGENDRGIPPATVKKFEEAMKEAGKKVAAVHEYQAGHGFMRPDNPTMKNPEYRAEAAKEAWQEIDKFFASTLKGK